jgi:hypothetical protein
MRNIERTQTALLNMFAFPEKHKLDFIKSILNLSNSDDAIEKLKEVMRLDDREFIEYIEKLDLISIYVKVVRLEVDSTSEMESEDSRRSDWLKAEA